MGDAGIGTAGGVLEDVVQVLDPAMTLPNWVSQNEASEQENEILKGEIKKMTEIHILKQWHNA